MQASEFIDYLFRRTNRCNGDRAVGEISENKRWLGGSEGYDSVCLDAHCIFSNRLVAVAIHAGPYVNRQHAAGALIDREDCELRNSLQWRLEARSQHGIN